MVERVVPDEIVEYDIKNKGLCVLRNVYARMPFGYRLAKKASIEAAEAERAFWSKLRELYPEAGSKQLQYDRQRKTVMWVEDGE